jgi:hypothetical protein
MTKTKMLMVAIIMIACVPAALAVDNVTPMTIDNETPESIEEVNGDLNSMSIPRGAVVRFMQLERQLDIKIQRAELLVSELVSDNTSPLLAIISELGLIKDEVSEYTTEESLSGMSVPEISVVFIDLKSDSQELIKEFKTLMHELRSDEEIDELKEDIETINEAKDARLKQRINSKIKDYNAERVRAMLTEMGVENETMIDEVMTGKINKGLIMKRLRNAYSALGENRKVNAALKIVQKATQEKIKKRVSVEQATNNTEDRKIQRLIR